MLGLGRVRLQCLRCRSEFTSQDEGSDKEPGATVSSRRSAVIRVKDRNEEEMTESEDSMAVTGRASSNWLSTRNFQSLKKNITTLRLNRVKSVGAAFPAMTLCALQAQVCLLSHSSLPFAMMPCYFTHKCSALL